MRSRDLIKTFDVMRYDEIQGIALILLYEDKERTIFCFKNGCLYKVAGRINTNFVEKNENEIL